MLVWGDRLPKRLPRFRLSRAQIETFRRNFAGRLFFCRNFGRLFFHFLVFRPNFFSGWKPKTFKKIPQFFAGEFSSFFVRNHAAALVRSGNYGLEVSNIQIRGNSKVWNYLEFGLINTTGYRQKSCWG